MITSKLFTLDPSRVNLYWDVFKYKMTVDITNIHFFRRAKTPEMFMEDVLYLQDNKWGRDIEIDNHDLISSVISWRQTLPTDGSIKIAIQYDRLVVYTNTIPLFQSLIDALDAYGDETSKLHIQYKQAKQLSTYERGVVYQKNPKHRYRIYLTSARRTPQQARDFCDTLTRYAVHPSRSLKSWLREDHSSNRFSQLFNQSGSWTWSHFNFDFDDETLITLLLLSHEEWIGKVCRIEKR